MSIKFSSVMLNVAHGVFCTLSGMPEIVAVIAAAKNCILLMQSPDADNVQSNRG